MKIEVAIHGLVLGLFFGIGFIFGHKRGYISGRIYGIEQAVNEIHKQYKPIKRTEQDDEIGER